MELTPAPAVWVKSFKVRLQAFILMSVVIIIIIKAKPDVKIGPMSGGS